MCVLVAGPEADTEEDFEDALFRNMNRDRDADTEEAFRDALFRNMNRDRDEDSDEQETSQDIPEVFDDLFNVIFNSNVTYPSGGSLGD